MSRRDTFCVYNKTHNMKICNKNGLIENRSVNINVTDFTDYLQIKVRDVDDFVFNYTTNIDHQSFDVLRREQNLDIDYSEFKTNLVDMLQQVLQQEMFLKCELESSRCNLVFYGKSKIKSLIFLIIDLQITNQQEIFNEMNNTIADLQNMNKNLHSQLEVSKRSLQDKDLEIIRFNSSCKELERRFIGNLQQISYAFSTELQNFTTRLLGRIFVLAKKLLKLIQEVEIIKTESVSKADSSTRLLQTMENLRIESMETTRIIEDLKRENQNLKATQYHNEEEIQELKRKIREKIDNFNDLLKERDELERDVKQATVIIAQKTVTNDELAKDVVQANQMLVNFNHLFDTKNHEIEALKNCVEMKDRVIQEHILNYNNLCREFDDYKSKFNMEEQNQLSQELLIANKRIEEVEKLNRETIKLNELLTRKLASGDFVHRPFHQQ